MNTELIIYFDPIDRSSNFYKLDLYQDISLPLTFSIADIRQVDKRKTDFSKTVTLPGTKNNNEVLGHLYEIGIDSSYDPRLKKSVVVLQDGLEIINGAMEINNIKRNNYYEIEYQVTLFGTFSNIFYQLGDSLIENLDLSQYDHVWEKANIVNSWWKNVIKDSATYNNFIYTDAITFSDVLYNNDPASYRAVLDFTGTHNFEVGDKLWILTDQSPNYYDGNYTVTRVVSTTQVEINNSFTSSGFSGTASKVEVTGEGYVYPMINYDKSAASMSFWSEQDFLPATYVKTVLDAIFKQAGFTYDSSFFESQYFKRLIIPCTGLFKRTDLDIKNANLNVGDALVQDRPYPYNMETQPGQYDSFTVVFPNDSTNGFSDPGGTYDPLTGLWVVDKAGDYDLKAAFILNPYVVIGDSICPTPPGPPAPDQDMYLISQIVGQVALVVNGADASVKNFNFGNNIQLGANTVPNRFLSQPVPAGDDNYDFGNLIVDFEVTKHLLQGDTVHWEIRYVHDRGGVWPELLTPPYTRGVQPFDLTIQNQQPWVEFIYAPNPPFNANTQTPCVDFWEYYGEIFMNLRGAAFSTQLHTTITVGDQIELNNALPRQLKCTDFLLSLIKMFNLYIDTDPAKQNLLHIEPRPEYYSTETIDWTTKLDISKPIELELMGAAIAKDYLFTYKPDKDWKNEEYNRLYSEIYGQTKYESINDFSKAESKVDVLFAPTPSIDEDTDSSNKIIPWIVKDATGAPFSSVPRILHYNGFSYSNKNWRLVTNVGSPIFPSAEFKILEVIVIDETHIDVRFNREPLESSANVPNKYVLTGTGAPGAATAASVEGNIAHLTFGAPISLTNLTTLNITSYERIVYSGLSGGTFAVGNIITGPGGKRSEVITDNGSTIMTVRNTPGEYFFTADTMDNGSGVTATVVGATGGTICDANNNDMSAFTYTFFFYNTFPRLYPQAGHLDQPQDPTIDLNWGPPLALYFSAASGHPAKYTDNNLFNRYYKDFIEEITDKDSKIVRAYLNLTAREIHNIDFSKLYIIDGHYLRLHEIKDYNAVGHGTTRCEFLKINSGTKFVPRLRSGYGGQDSPVPEHKKKQILVFGQNRVPNLSGTSTVTGYGNTIGTGSFNTGIVGIGNEIGEESSVISVFGNNNNVGSGSTGVIIQGSNNTVPGGLINVTIIGMDNVTATSSDTAYINGVIIQNGSYSALVDVVDANEDIVLTQFGSAKPYQVIDAGQNVPLPFGSLDPNTSVDARFPV